MKKFYKLLITVAATLLLFLTQHGVVVSALTIDPSDTNIQYNSTVEFSLKAFPPDGNQNAVSLRLLIENASLVSYLPPVDSGFLAITKDCSNGEYIENNQLCVSLVKNGSIIAGDDLGKINIFFDKNDSKVILSKNQGNGYSDGNSFTSELGVMSIYTVGTPAAISYPVSSAVVTETQLSSSAAAFIIIVLVFAAVFIFAMFLLKNREKLRNLLPPTLQSFSRTKNFKVIFTIILILLLLVISLVIGQKIIQNQAPESSQAAIVNVPASGSVCGEGCNQDSDCKTPTGGGVAVCRNNICENRDCPTGKTTFGTICSCGFAGRKCGQTCGANVGLCGDGVSTCAFVGRTCTNNEFSNPPVTCIPNSIFAKQVAGWSTEGIFACGGNSWFQYQGRTPTQAEIQAVCDAEIQLKYKCNTNTYTCMQANDGTYDTSEDCLTNCVAPTSGPACKSLWWTDSNDKTCGTQKQFCGVYMYQGLQTYNTQAECLSIVNIIQCGPMDSNGDGKLDLVDLAAFGKAYGKTCNDTGANYGLCSGKDSNGDGVINIVDFANFGKRYNKPSCSTT